MLPPTAPVNQFIQVIVPTEGITTTSWLPEGLRALERHPQFILYRRADKVPFSYKTGAAANPHHADSWTDWATASTVATSWGAGFGIGFALTAAARKAVIDIDNCRDPLTGRLSEMALFIISLLPGAYVEVSISGRGLHIWFSYSGEMPAHRDKVAGVGEFYHTARYFAIGTPYVAEGFVQGSVETDMTAMLPALVAALFPPDTAASAGGDDLGWTEEPVSEWHPPVTDKEELLKLFLAVPVKLSAEWAFGKPEDNKKPPVSNADLWYGKEGALIARWPPFKPREDGLPYDASGADMSLASRLAYQFGKNCEVIEEMMRRPDCALVRDRWDQPRRDYGTYLRMTIQKAVAQQTRVLGDNRSPEGLGAAVAGTHLLSAGAAVPLGAPLTVPSGSANELTPEDFWACLPIHGYIHRRTRKPWSVDAVNGHLKRFSDQLGMKPSTWLDQFRAVTELSWQPGYPEIIEGKVAVDGTLKDDPKGRIYNLFRPSDAVATEGDVSPWLNRVRTIYPDDADYIIQWMAYRIKNPGKKINHALVLGGKQGIGKDWMLEPLRYGVGKGNFKNADPDELFRPFSEWVERTLLVNQ
jgi:hypothetical protein